MGNEDAKRLILARRARFVAAALASAAMACGGDTESNPNPCLSARLEDSGAKADAEPQPCLDPSVPDAGDDASPHPCLSVAADAGDGGDGGDAGDGG